MLPEGIKHHHSSELLDEPLRTGWKEGLLVIDIRALPAVMISSIKKVGGMVEEHRAQGVLEAVISPCLFDID